ncbi:MAG: HYR domain-containing protein [Acidimicrobiia bacterium]
MGRVGRPAVVGLLGLLVGLSAAVATGPATAVIGDDTLDLKAGGGPVEWGGPKDFDVEIKKVGTCETTVASPSIVHLAIPAALTVSWNATLPAGVSAVNPPDITFTDCKKFGKAFNVKSKTPNDYDIVASSGTKSVTVTITVPPNTAPTLSYDDLKVAYPPDGHDGIQTIEATGPTGVSGVIYTITAKDKEDDKLKDPVLPSPTCNKDPLGASYPLGDTLVTCSVTDSGGLETSASFTMKVVDTTAPTLTLPSNKQVEGNTTGGANATAAALGATVTDVVDPNPTVSCTPSFFPLGGPTSASCTGKDASGNESVPLNIDVTVVDTTPPVITPPPVPVEATGPTGATVNWSAADLVDSTPTLVCKDKASALVVTPGLLPVGTDITVTCDATDDSNNASAKEFPVKVQDTTPPTLQNVPADITKEATGPDGAIVTYPSPTATDVVDATPTVACAPVSGSTFSLGTTVVTCTATDDFANESTATFNVVVAQDTTPPTLENVPADIIAIANDANGANVDYTPPTATDGGSAPAAVAAAESVDSQAMVVDCGPASGSLFKVGTTDVLCTATDAANNTASATFKVIVNYTPPAAAPPSVLAATAARPAASSLAFTGSGSMLQIAGMLALALGLILVAGGAPPPRRPHRPRAPPPPRSPTPTDVGAPGTATARRRSHQMWADGTATMPCLRGSRAPIV